MKSLRQIDWSAFQALSPEDKAPYLLEDGHLYHVLLAQQFDRSLLDSLGALATKIRFMAKTEAGMAFLAGLLPYKRSMLYFTQPSTRTFLSFRSACQILGMAIGDVRDRSTSSEFKGESQEDSVRTFSSYFDLIVMRTKTKGLAERMAWVLSNSDRTIPIVNAGSGQDQHPTQALLDIYTLQRSFENRGGIDGKHIVFCGDLARGRTVRSLALLLLNYSDVTLSFAAPEELQVGEDVRTVLSAAGIPFDLRHDFKALLPEADAVYMTRIQDEWDAHKGDSARIDTHAYRITGDDLADMKPDAVIMHPLPRRDEIATDVDADPRAVYWRQMRNGMWIRTAIIAAIFGCAQKIDAYYDAHC